MLKTFIFSLFFVLFLVHSNISFAQNILPNQWTQFEKENLKIAVQENDIGIPAPPTVPVRTPAEWEEADALVITWTGYQDILTEITRHAVEELDVFIVTSNPQNVSNQLTNNGVGLERVNFVNDDFDSIWIRDYGQWCVYEEGSNDIRFIDWIYNRPRPNDDVIPLTVAEVFDTPIHETTAAPYNLVATGGNFMVDGLGTAFSSRLIVQENTIEYYNDNNMDFDEQDESEILDVLGDFMGIHTYVLMETLPYDAIHHIDMHMKLLDEETILIGEYPEGVADGPQIEQNIQYIKDNFVSAFGTPYRFVRIPMPPQDGGYPNGEWWGADYRTYANLIFLNETVLVPIYEEQFDTVGLKILQENLPGYKVQGIDCNDIIPSSGALHCITKLVMTDDPLHLVHQPIRDQVEANISFPIEVYANHSEGIATVKLYFKTDNEEIFNETILTPMTDESGNWTGDIPALNINETRQYYVEAFANNGKTIARPMTAPEGYWEHYTEGNITSVEQVSNVNETIGVIYPNPANIGVHIPIILAGATSGTLQMIGINGQQILLEREINTSGNSVQYVDVEGFNTGIYIVKVVSQNGIQTKKLMIQH